MKLISRKTAKPSCFRTDNGWEIVLARPVAGFSLAVTSQMRFCKRERERKNKMTKVVFALVRTRLVAESEVTCGKKLLSTNEPSHTHIFMSRSRTN